MSVSPEQQLRAYVEYFRDLGVYELYQRESPRVGMPEQWRELLARPKATPVPTGAAAKPSAAAAVNAPARPGTSTARPLQPARTTAQPMQAQIPQTRVEP